MNATGRTKVLAYFTAPDGSCERFEMDPTDYFDAKQRFPADWSLTAPAGVEIRTAIWLNGVRAGERVVVSAAGVEQPLPRAKPRVVASTAPDVLAEQLAEQARAKAVEAARDKADGVVVPLAPTRH